MSRLVSEATMQTVFDRWDELIREAPAARAARVRAEHIRKRTLAALYRQAPAGSVKDREAWAETQAGYAAACDDEVAAIESDERCRTELNRISALTEAWRTEQATIRANKF